MRNLKEFSESMRSVAIICEYNPFHFGHEYLISRVKAKLPDCAVISIMSGSTVQRGELSVCGKYERAKYAVLGGSDLVLELPFPFSCSAGEQFARAGVFIANKLMVDFIAFGSECGGVELLKNHAKNLLSKEFDAELGARAKANPKTSFIRLREQLYREIFEYDLPSKGNDVLGIEYIKAIISYGYNITPIAVKRAESYSATKSRRALHDGDEAEAERLIPDAFIPKNIHPGLCGISKLILGNLRLGNVSDGGNGILNALISCAEKTNDYDEFISLLPTSVYTSARLRREIIASLFGVTDEMKNEQPTFTVLLGASKRGMEYLSLKRKLLDFPILTKNSDISAHPEISKAQIELCKRADSIYSLAGGCARTSFFEKPFIVK